MLPMNSDCEVMTTTRIIDLHYSSVNQVRPGNARQIYHLSYNFLPLFFQKQHKTKIKLNNTEGQERDM